MKLQHYPDGSAISLGDRVWIQLDGVSVAGLYDGPATITLAHVPGESWTWALVKTDEGEVFAVTPASLAKVRVTPEITALEAAIGAHYADDEAEA